jgi:pimeloyl-ACP methyl ester carboxylesterase
VSEFALVDRSRHVTITFRSPYDGTPQQADVHAPEEEPRTPIPLVLAPHPIGWTAAQDYFGGIEGLKRGVHPGWKGLAHRHGVLIAQPHGHGRMDPLASCAFEGQIDDMAFLIDALPAYGFPVDRHRVYACGLSMGGLETVVLLGRYPDRITAGFAFNPVVDLAAWHEELSTSPVADIRAYRTWERIAREVGGDPDEIPDAYHLRSGFAYLEALTRTPLMLYWTRFDPVVPRQETHHALRLYREIKSRSATSPVAEYEHTLSHGSLPAEDDWEAGWRLHEYADYDLALCWLLRHRKDL